MTEYDLAAISQARLQRLRKRCKKHDTDAFFVRDTSNIAWLTAFEQVFDTEAAHAAFVDDDVAVLHTDTRYLTAAKAAAAEGPWKVACDGVSHATWLHRMLEPDTALGIESSISLEEFRRLEAEFKKTAEGQLQLNAPRCIQETKGRILSLRKVKDAYEVECMKAAQAVTDAAFAHILEFIKPGMTEREVQIELEDFMLRHGGQGLAFSSIVATGANGASPHAIPGDTRLEAGQCVVMDFGARALGYCSDMTRMVFIGEPSQRIRQAYSVLREANEAVEAMLAPGVTGAQAHELAEEVLAKGGFGKKMGHALGHGVGIDIHEEPVLAPRNTKPLKVGNVVTVEPGIYLEGEFGMRLEDCGIIIDGGFEVFTKSSHDMAII